MRLPRRTHLIPLLVLVILLTNPGCWVPYVLSAGIGELGVLLGSRPMQDVLNGGGLDATTQAKLWYVLDVRDYAIDILGLEGGDSYSVFYDSDGGDVLYNVSACRKDTFEPYVWTFPFAGSFEYIGFFTECQADMWVKLLEDAGWDVFKYAPGGYSTLGWFPDPLFSNALSRDKIDLAELVIHEFTHNTAYKAGNSVFNESLATFVGRTGALWYLADRFRDNTQLQAFAKARWQDGDLYNQFWAALYQALDTLYGREDLTSEQKIAQREDVIAEYKQKFEDEYMPSMNEPNRYAGLLDLDIDNAYVLIQRRYNLDMDLFQEVYDALGQELPEAIDVFTASAGADDPKQYLRDWVAEHQ